MESKNPFEGIKTYDSYTHLWQLTGFVFVLQILAAGLTYLGGHLFGFQLKALEAFLPATLVSIYVCWAALETVGVDWRAALADWNAKARSDAFKSLKYLGGYLLVVGAMVALAMALFYGFGLDESVLDAAPDRLEAGVAEALFSPLRFTLMLLVMCVLAPIEEELLFRRVMFTTFRRKHGFWASAMASGLLFALFHGRNALFVFPVGVYLCWVYERERRLPVNIMLHGLVNLAVTAFKTLA